jgi:single-stranded-DNA-specific exonuclease
VESFRHELARHAACVLEPRDLLPEERVDAVVPGGALGLELAEELERLRPFGPGNPQPTLLVPAARLEAVGAMGKERQHARFTVASGGARSRAVAFGTSARSLAVAGDEPHDVAVRLERNRWNGLVEPRLVLRALCPTRAGTLRVLGEDEPFWIRVERELARDLEESPPAGGVSREVLDRRAEGVAGVAGELLSSGEPVLVLVADVARRRASLERLLAGLTPGVLAVAAWDALEEDPALGAEFPHMLALDPSALSEPGLLESVPGPPGALAHLAWGPPEADFALRVAHAELDLRAPLAEAWRALRAVGEGEAESALRGEGRYPRSPALCGRLLRVLCELELVAYLPSAQGGPSCRVLKAPRTSLERSSAYAAYAARLAAARARLGATPPAAAPAAALAAR